MTDFFEIKSKNTFSVVRCDNNGTAVGEFPERAESRSARGALPTYIFCPYLWIWGNSHQIIPDFATGLRTETKKLKIFTHKKVWEYFTVFKNFFRRKYAEIFRRIPNPVANSGIIVFLCEICFNTLVRNQAQRDNIMKKNTKYTDEPIEFKEIKDFLPSPEHLAFKEKKC